MQMTNRGSDARLDAVDLENMLRGISDHSALCSAWWTPRFVPNHFGPIESPNLQKQQIESNLQSQPVKSNLLGLNRITMCLKSRFKSNCDLILPTTGLPPKFGSAKKTWEIWRNFWQLLTLIANISETDRQTENWKSTYNPSHIGWKKLNFGPQTKKLLTCILHTDPPKCTFLWRLYFGP